MGARNPWRVSTIIAFLLATLPVLLECAIIPFNEETRSGLVRRSPGRPDKVGESRAKQTSSQQDSDDDRPQQRRPTYSGSSYDPSAGVFGVSQYLDRPGAQRPSHFQQQPYQPPQPRLPEAQSPSQLQHQPYSPLPPRPLGVHRHSQSQQQPYNPPPPRAFSAGDHLGPSRKHSSQRYQQQSYDPPSGERLYHFAQGHRNDPIEDLDGEFRRMTTRGPSDISQVATSGRPRSPEQLYPIYDFEQEQVQRYDDSGSMFQRSEPQPQNAPRNSFSALPHNPFSAPLGNPPSAAVGHPYSGQPGSASTLPGSQARKRPSWRWFVASWVKRFPRNA